MNFRHFLSLKVSGVVEDVDLVTDPVFLTFIPES